MFDFSNFELLLRFDAQSWALLLLSIVGGGILASSLIAFYTQSKWKLIFKHAFRSKILPYSILAGLLDAVFVIWLYGLDDYAVFIACVLGLLYVMAYIDSLLLAVPDFLNFLCLFFVFVGLYELSLLREEHLISAFASSGALALLRIFGSFIFKKEILGEADLVIFASMSAIVLLEASVYLMIVSCFLAMGYIVLLGLSSLQERQIALFEIKIPFVVFLSLGFVAILAYQRFAQGWIF